jgi:hypothetical protein
MAVYDEALDKGQRQELDSSSGVNRVSRMTWYIFKGEELKRENKITFPFYRTLDHDYESEDLIFRDDLMHSEQKTAPTHPSASATKTNCTLTADLRNVDRTKFKKRTGVDGKQWVDVHYSLIVRTGATLRFSMEFLGEEIGGMEASYA